MGSCTTMRRIALAVTLLVLSLAACGEEGQRSGNAVVALPVSMDLSGYSRVHEFRAKDGKVLAGLYGQSVAPEIFSELLIVDEKGSRRVIYLLDRSRFLGTHGVDTEPESSGFYGYKVLLKAPDHIVVNYMSNGGKNVSDDVTIGWNYEAGRFELEKAP